MTGGVILPGVAFVTGGGRGLGLAVACAYAQEGATAVVLVDIHDEKTMSAAKEQVEALGAKVKVFMRGLCHSLTGVLNL